MTGTGGLRLADSVNTRGPGVSETAGLPPTLAFPQTSILSLGKPGIRRVWPGNSFTPYLPIPLAGCPSRHPQYGDKGRISTKAPNDISVFREELLEKAETYHNLI